jgi:hypothetical protein
MSRFEPLLPLDGSMDAFSLLPRPDLILETAQTFDFVFGLFGQLSDHRSGLTGRAYLI